MNQVLSTVKPVTDEVVKVEKATSQVVENLVGEVVNPNPSVQAVTKEVQKVEQNTNKLVGYVVTEITKPNATVNAVTDEVNKLTNQKLTGAKEGLSKVTNTANTTVNVVDGTVNSLPEVPVVTPVLKETTNTLKTVTSKVQDTVSTGDEAIKETITSVENVFAPPPPKMQDTEKPNTVIETNNPTPVTQKEPTAGSNLPDLIEETGKDLPIVEVTKPGKSSKLIRLEASLEDLDTPEVTVENGTNTEAVKELVTKENFMPQALQTMENTKNTVQTEAKVVNEVSVESETPLIPIEPGANHAKVMLNSSTVFFGNTHVNTTGHSSVTGHDVLPGLLPSQEMMKELKRKKWYHKNSYAIIQWFHTPLRKPPETTPFLYVM